MEAKNYLSENEKKALTSIHDAYTLSNTNEVDSVMLNNFLNTLAEVAMAIASRKSQEIKL